MIQGNYWTVVFSLISHRVHDTILTHYMIHHTILQHFRVNGSFCTPNRVHQNLKKSQRNPDAPVKMLTWLSGWTNNTMLCLGAAFFISSTGIITLKMYMIQSEGLGIV